VALFSWLRAPKNGLVTLTAPVNGLAGLMPLIGGLVYGASFLPPLSTPSVRGLGYGIVFLAERLLRMVWMSSHPSVNGLVGVTPLYKRFGRLRDFTVGLPIYKWCRLYVDFSAGLSSPSIGGSVCSVSFCPAPPSISGVVWVVDFCAGLGRAIGFESAAVV
jgi:hypothetical protein